MIGRFVLQSLILTAVTIVGEASVVAQQLKILNPGLVHLRSGSAREWSSFPEQPETDHLEFRFLAAKNATEMSLALRQQDVKQVWRVLLNGKSLVELVRDENDQILYLAIPAGTLKDGENLLRIESPARAAAVSEDIRVGEIWIDVRPRAQSLSEATLLLQVLDEGSREPLPSRITIVSEGGALQALGTLSNDKLAVRAGVVYTADGFARVSLPAGKYTVSAGRGFEYSVASADASVGVGEIIARTLVIRRDVDTTAYVACDTHIHTLTHSGHGDASSAERMITLAGEGIELPIATDHNVQIDYEPQARQLGVRRFFTPVVGNEVTTALGHFNVWPTTAAAQIL